MFCPLIHSTAATATAFDVRGNRLPKVPQQHEERADAVRHEVFQEGADEAAEARPPAHDSDAELVLKLKLARGLPLLTQRPCGRGSRSRRRRSSRRSRSGGGAAAGGGRHTSSRKSGSRRRSSRSSSGSRSGSSSGGGGSSRRRVLARVPSAQRPCQQRRRRAGAPCHTAAPARAHVHRGAERALQQQPQLAYGGDEQGDEGLGRVRGYLEEGMGEGGGGGKLGW